MIRKLLFMTLFLSAMPFAVYAVEPDEMLADSVLEVRAREVSKKLRCVVCQNQDIDSSNSGVARDLRILVRERLTKGDTNAEVLTFIHARYGDFVLLKPPFKPETYALWLAPIILILIGTGGVIAVLSKASRLTAITALNTDDERAVADMLAQDKKDRS
ncbi:cytochrome c-type biogenesis protein CcmH [Rhodobacteraceae bacterium LMO-12]|nr:cytochrome c-type biogenesis protein CcmH [Rhodobacteraceae bacterium LMO-JJ12]